LLDYFDPLKWPRGLDPSSVGASVTGLRLVVRSLVPVKSITELPDENTDRGIMDFMGSKAVSQGGEREGGGQVVATPQQGAQAVNPVTIPTEQAHEFACTLVGLPGGGALVTLVTKGGGATSLLSLGRDPVPKAVYGASYEVRGVKAAPRH
jgi:hypothetical protein